MMTRTNRRFVTTLLGLAAVAPLGCYDGFGTASNAESAPVPSTDDDDGGSESGGDDDEGGNPPAPGQPEPPDTPLARITNAEVVATMAQFLGTELPEATLVAALATEQENHGLTSDSSQQYMTQARAEALLQLGPSVADVIFDSFESEGEFASWFGCEDTEQEASSCVRRFFVERLDRAFRTDEFGGVIGQMDIQLSHVDDALAIHEVPAGSLEAQELRVATLLSYIVLSPEFLLVVERGQDRDATTRTTLTAREIATRMSLLLTGRANHEQLTLQGDTLLTASGRRAAAASVLNSEAGVEHVANLMERWLGIDPGVAGNADAAAVHTRLREWFEQDEAFGNLYEAPVLVLSEGGHSIMPVGVLGQNGFVASHTVQGSPPFINRGVFVVERMLCQALSAPPSEAFDGDVSSYTEEEIFTIHSEEPSCAACHATFDDFGAAFQHYNPDTGLLDPDHEPLGDGAFELTPIGDVSGTVSNVSDLAAVMGSSRRARQCVAGLWWRHALRRSLGVEGWDEAVMERLESKWDEAESSSLRELLFQIVESEEFVSLYWGRTGPWKGP